MELFTHDAALPGRRQRGGGRIQTPLGNIITSFWLYDEEMPPASGGDEVRLANGAVIQRWEESAGDFEVLQTSVVPPLPPPMRVQECRAVLWRFVPSRRTGPFLYRAYWQPGYVWLTGVPEPGPRLDGQTWTDGQTTVSMGTEGADALAFRASQGEMLPMRLAEDLWSKGQNRVMWDDESLFVAMPELEAGELCQLQSVVAWGPAGEAGVASWFALDISPHQILDAAGCQ